MELTEEQAIELCKSGFWKDITPEERCKFQLYTRRLCMPWDVFRAAVDQTLGRQVYTHEYGLRVKELQEEFEGKRGKPTLEDLLECIPDSVKKMMVVQLPANKECAKNNHNYEELERWEHDDLVDILYKCVDCGVEYTETWPYYMV